MTDDGKYSLFLYNVLELSNGSYEENCDYKRMAKRQIIPDTLEWRPLSNPNKIDAS